VKRLNTGVLAAIVVAGIGTTSVSAQQSPVAQGKIAHSPTTIAQQTPTSTTPSADFGSPPSGEVPIFFNDRHVYAKPDTLKQNRVLAALVRGNTILIPLRSMFEQMGATVSYDPASRTADVTKPGSDVKVTVGRPEVIINGESRPLDVPPEIYKGAVVVPVRVISEGMGAYVQWVPDRRVVVVRYVAAAPPTPPPTPVPTLPPTPIPTVPPTPAPTPRPVVYEHFIVGDYIFQPKAYNEFDPGNPGRNGPSYSARAAVEFPLFGLPWMLEADGRQYTYDHFGDFDTTVPRNAPCVAANVGPNRGCVTPIGGVGSVYVPSFSARDRDIEGRFALKVADPRIYIGVGYLWRNDNYGYPQQHGVGFGVEKLPDLDNFVSLFGSYWYYPSVTGYYTDPLGNKFNLSYRIQKYQAGVNVSPFYRTAAGVFLEGGFEGDIGNIRMNAPIEFKHYGWFGGVGIKF
jgi:Copper amine oxidase N-terminal domain